MRLMAFRSDGQRRLGIVTDHGVSEVSLTWEQLWAEPARLRDLQALGPGLDPASLEPEQPLPPAGKLLCVGLNYRRHAEESGAAIPETPVLFSKFANTPAPDGADVSLPAAAEQYDYEVELGVLIGRRTRDVAVEDALGAVFGYVNCNDLSARDLQLRTSQWLLGKTLDGFLPIGPYVVTADEVPDPQDLAVRCWVNGELRQDANTKDMIFGVAELIAYASRYFTLEPGDLISTGTPAGVAMGMPGQPWLRAGDIVEVEVGDGRFGRLRNRLVAPVAAAVA